MKGWVVGILGAVIVIAFGIIVVIAWWMGTEEELRVLEQNVEREFSDVLAQYKKRANVMPEMLSIVKTHLQEEERKNTKGRKDEVLPISLPYHIENIAMVAGQDVTTDILGKPASLEAYIVNQNDLTETYETFITWVGRKAPAVLSNQTFTTLRAQQQVATKSVMHALTKYNETTRAYNTLIEHFPTSLVAGVTGREARREFVFEDDEQERPLIAVE